MNYKRVALLWITGLAFSMAMAQSQTNVVAFNSSRWEHRAKQVTEELYRGKKSILVIDGSIILKDAAFKNGIIEFDMALEHDRYFPGVAFRMQDTADMEQYYVRPHQSGNPDAMQYYPVYHGGDSWQLYYGEGFSNAHAIPAEGWLHLRLLVHDSMAEVYFDKEPMPVLFISRLKRPLTAGMIALQNLSDVPVRFANFAYSNDDRVMLLSKPKPAAALSKGTVLSWQVSNSFDESLVKEKTLLQSNDTAALHWQTLAADERGIADFYILAGVTKAANTVFAKTTIWSDRDEIKKFNFGFSDRARVYCNGRLLYAGDDGYKSRDYRFLGTIGFYDAVYLDLKKGKNEIWVAVSENFGGWGIEEELIKVLPALWPPAPVVLMVGHLYF